MIKIIKQKIKSFFLAGLLVTLPVAFTLYFVFILFNFFDRFLGPLFTKLLIRFGVPITPAYHIPGVGIVMTILLIFVVGILVTNFIGRKVVYLGEFIFTKIPIMGSIYSALKQLIGTFTKSDSSAFKKAVMFKYPIGGIYTIGFVSSETYYKIQDLIEEEVVNVFVPTVPNVTTGFFFIIPKKDLIPIPMEMEDTMKMMISGGMILPKDKRVSKSAQDNQE